MEGLTDYVWVPARKLIHELPDNTTEATFDAAYDAGDIYATIKDQGARPLIQYRENARTTTLDARGRAIHYKRPYGTRWDRRYHWRPITEAVKSSLKRRFGDRLHSNGLHNQRQDSASTGGAMLGDSTFRNWPSPTIVQFPQDRTYRTSPSQTHPIRSNRVRP